ncbi:aldose 1-epimerase family protein [Postechiella marina]|uniref:Aldose 1-epimerase family protein n=1 Tax=Postechiella marina TaxID=943941 RepID=A0ABP8BZN1_9FLAO
MYSIENNKLKISVKKTGAELCKISSVKNHTDFMWHANPDVWGSFAPNLFPVIGNLKNGGYILDNKTYTLPKHGFIRNNEAVQLLEQTPESLTFGLSYNEYLLKIYPFKFEFSICYVLKGNSIDVIHTVKNLDTKTMYFSLGGHPAFKCPVYKNENYSDYFLEFEHKETSKTHLINTENGLISPTTKHIFNNSNILNLKHELFNDDALIFKNLVSRKVALKSRNKGTILSLEYNDFPYLGIWAKPNGDYVCIEPWLGIADNENTNQNIKTKEGILTLDAGKTFKASYTIEIDESQLK